ncbi:MAG TPA: CHAD domain-containing protein [Falsiroseomonas sp.]|jgi:CHAD domain-containing protein|nr:CHAD domain-containing protein [Falsiroseomonas sp.]
MPAPVAATEPRDAAPETTRFTLEAALPPDAAEALFRTGPLAGLRAGRSRGTPFGVSWLDTADGALAAEGLALEQPRRGPRRLLRTLPVRSTIWHPGAPPEPLGTLAAGEAPPEAGKSPLLPVAGFAGTATRLALAGGVEALLLKGRLRAVTDEAPVARLTLAGPAAGVLAAMHELAAELPALPPRAALAEEGRALARAEPPRPRRLGPPALDPQHGVEDALVLALGHLTEVMLWHAPAARAGTTPEGVHQMRVAMRRMRSLLKVFRPACDGAALRGFDARLKGLAALLGPARDWDVWLGGLGTEISGALPEEPRIAALLRAARGQREAAYATLRPALDGPGLRAVAWAAVALAETRPWRDESEEAAAELRAGTLPDFAAGVLDKRWRRIAAAGTDIGALPDAEFHALRIEAKRMRYAGELFAPLWGRKRARRFLARLAEVQDAFGLANDAVVAHGLMMTLAGRGDGGLAWAGGVAEGWALARARRARSKAKRAWEDLVAGGTYWNQD